MSSTSGISGSPFAPLPDHVTQVSRCACVPLPGQAIGEFTLPHISNLFWAGRVTLTHPKGLNPRTSAGLQSLKEKKPGALVGGEPVGEDAKRAEPRAKDTQMAGPDDTTETPSPAASAKGSTPGRFVT